MVLIVLLVFAFLYMPTFKPCIVHALTQDKESVKKCYIVTTCTDAEKKVLQLTADLEKRQEDLQESEETRDELENHIKVRYNKSCISKTYFVKKLES